MKTLMWYTEGLNKYLSSKGFGHFSDKEPVEFDFREGRAFFFDLEKKTFGLTDLIPSDKSEAAMRLTTEFREFKSIKLLEELCAN